MRERKFELKDKLFVYNNLGKYKEFAGRLTVNMIVNPTPRIVWDFEIPSIEGIKFVGDELSRLMNGEKTTEPIDGVNIEVHGLDIKRTALIGVDWPMLAGFAEEVVEGGDVPAQLIHFYLPNCRALTNSHIFQYQIIRAQKYIYDVGDHYDDEGEEIGEASEVAYRMNFPLDAKGDWVCCLEYSVEASRWLQSRGSHVLDLEKSFGTFITTKGSIDLSAVMSTGKPVVDVSKLKAIKDVTPTINGLCQMLTFANGGYINPLCIESFGNENPSWQEGSSLKKPDPSVLSRLCAKYQPARVTPIEMLGGTWIGEDDSIELPEYFKCLPEMIKMLDNAPWQEEWHLIMSWYLQAIQPQDIQTPQKSTAIIANALGAALERLSYVILVLEEPNSVKRSDMEMLFDIKPDRKNREKVWPILKSVRPTNLRLQLLLERIGLSVARGNSDVNRIQQFLDVRNDATHPRPGAVTEAQRKESIRLAIQWIEETLLWRLGYNSYYMSRSVPKPIKRIDLSTRQPLVR